jgi:C_GCAxxG_C_C family probable redox protein
MWEAYGLKYEDFLWAATAFMGGIAGQQDAPCGAVSGAAIALGLGHRVSGNDKAKAEQARQKIRAEVSEYLNSFRNKFGSITCRGVLGVDLSDEEGMKKAREAGLFRDKCPLFVQFAIEKLYEIESKRA